VSIYHETFVQAPSVLVLRGGAAFLETMRYQIQDLAADHTVIAPGATHMAPLEDPTTVDAAIRRFLGSQ
jgi:pimeloyl-ACP methyl ester carboxylesterase